MVIDHTVFSAGGARQELTGYASIVAVIVLASAAIFLGSGNSVGSIWSSAGNTLQTAAGGTSAPSDRDCDHCGDGHH